MGGESPPKAAMEWKRSRWKLCDVHDGPNIRGHGVTNTQGILSGEKGRVRKTDTERFAVID